MGTDPSALHYKQPSKIESNDFYSGLREGVFHMYQLSDGTIVCVSRLVSSGTSSPCTRQFYYEKGYVSCGGFIDVNGPELPNKWITKCSDGQKMSNLFLKTVQLQIRIYQMYFKFSFLTIRLN